MKNIKIQSLLVAVALLSVYASYSIGMNQYPGYDASLMVNLAYRLELGQTAPRDFFSPMPPLFSLGSKIAFVLFGSYWAALCALGALFYVGAAFIIGRASMAITESWRAILTALVCFFLSGIFYGFWWHNTMTGLVGAILMLFFTEQAISRKIDASLGILCGILITTKPNIAFPMFALVQVWIWAPRHIVGITKLAAVECTAISFLTAIAISYASGQSPTEYLRAISDIAAKRVAAPVGILLHSSSSIQNYARNASIFALVQILIVLGSLLIVSVVPNLKAEASAKIQTPNLRTEINVRRYATFVCLACTLAGIALNGDYFHASLPILAALIAILPRFEFKNLRRVVIFPVKVLIGGAATIFFAHVGMGGLNRDRVYTTGPGAFWEPPSSSTVAGAGFFKNATIGWQLQQFNREVEMFLKNRLGDKVFFGPRVEFGYAAFSKVPPRGMPLWFDSEAAWPAGAERKVLENFRANKFDVLIFFQGDTTNMPSDLIETIDREFINALPTSKFQQATILIRK